MKDCVNCNETSSFSYSRCNPPLSSNCLFYQGEALTCSSDPNFTVCKGDNMSVVQENIFNKICELSGQNDVTSIEFPCSLQDGWREQDPTLLNLLSYFAQLACDQKTSIDNLTTSIEDINPSVDICLECCGDDCGTVKILLSEALNKIVACLCAAKAQITQLQAEVEILNTSYNGLQEQLNLLKTFQTEQLTLNIDLQLRLLAVEGKTNCLPECP